MLFLLALSDKLSCNMMITVLSNDRQLMMIEISCTHKSFDSTRFDWQFKID